MSNYQRVDTKDGTYFFTVVTYRRQRFLCDEHVRNALREGIKVTRLTRPFTIDAWVLENDGINSMVRGTHPTGEIKQME
jgi:putative transposase